MTSTNLAEYRCSRDDCTFPSGGSCARAAEFSDPPNSCPHLVTVHAEPRSRAAAGEPTAPSTAPWSGNELVPEDLSRQLAGARPHVMAVLGERDCGKTTFLTSLFLEIANGNALLPYKFASSFTLKRLHALALEASNGNVVRTPRTGVARFIHLGLRPADERDDRVLDVLFSDIDGEVVRDHAKYASDETQRVLSFLTRADAVLFLVDAHRMLQSDGEAYAQRNADVILRVLSDVAPVERKPFFALVLTKYDRVIGRVSLPPSKERLQPGAWGNIAFEMRPLCAQMNRAQKSGHRVEFFMTSAFPKRLTSDEYSSGVSASARAVIEYSDERWAIGVHAPEMDPGGPSFLAVGSERRGY